MKKHGAALSHSFLPGISGGIGPDTSRARECIERKIAEGAKRVYGIGVGRSVSLGSPKPCTPIADPTRYRRLEGGPVDKKWLNAGTSGERG